MTHGAFPMDVCTRPSLRNPLDEAEPPGWTPQSPRYHESAASAVSHDADLAELLGEEVGTPIVEPVGDCFPRPSALVGLTRATRRAYLHRAKTHGIFSIQVRCLESTMLRYTLYHRAPGFVSSAPDSEDECRPPNVCLPLEWRLFVMEEEHATELGRVYPAHELWRRTLDDTTKVPFGRRVARDAEDALRWVVPRTPTVEDVNDTLDLWDLFSNVTWLYAKAILPLRNALHRMEEANAKEYRRWSYARGYARLFSHDRAGRMSPL